MTSSRLRYAAAACQTDLPNPRTRDEMRANTDRMIEMIDAAVIGSQPFLPVRLVVFPEFAHAAPAYARVESLLEHLAVQIPNEHTDRLAQRARQHDIYIQSGSMIEVDPRWPGVVFNTTCLIGPDGILTRYRKVNPWIPFEVHASPHDIPGYDEPLFPVADTPIGRLGCAICYDWLFPEAIRQLAANGAEVLIRVSAYMDPWGATEPMNWWTLVNRTRALENMAYVVAANQGASLAHYPPYSWPGGSQVVDFDGPAARGGVARPRRAHRRRADRHRCAAPRARHAHRPPHAGAPADVGVPDLPAARLPARRRRVSDHLRIERRADRDAQGETDHRRVGPIG